MTTEYIGMDLVSKGVDEKATILCGKRAGKDLKIYAIARISVLPKKYLYGIVCLDKEDGDPKIITKIKYYRLSTVRRRFRNISTAYTKG